MSDLDGAVFPTDRPIIDADCEPRVVELLRQCWHEDPKQRPTFMEVREWCMYVCMYACVYVIKNHIFVYTTFDMSAVLCSMCRWVSMW